MVARCNLKPGTSVHIDEVTNGLYLRQPVTRLAKVYVEPTNQCNLACRTCSRNTWDEPMSHLADATFGVVIQGLRAFSAPPTAFLGAFGEPVSHPHIVGMVAQAKSFGARVEIITNGTMLTDVLSQRLIAAGPDMLWVSVDGATPESYADVRLGAALLQVLANVAHFRDSRRLTHLNPGGPD